GEQREIIVRTEPSNDDPWRRAHAASRRAPPPSVLPGTQRDRFAGGSLRQVSSSVRDTPGHFLGQGPPLELRQKGERVLSGERRGGFDGLGHAGIVAVVVRLA